jgi:hypothetical protein
MGDDARSYKELADGVLEAIRPRDIFEVFWAKDVADYTWEIQRYRKIEAKLLDEQPRTSGCSEEEQSYAGSLADLEVSTWVLEQSELTGKDRNALWIEIAPERRRLEEEYEADSLARHAVSHPEQSLAQSFLKNAAGFERISRAISMSQSRLTAALKEIERHRVRKSSRSDDPTTDIIDAVFTDSPS